MSQNDFIDKLKLNSDRIFIKSSDRQISFKEFKFFAKGISSELETKQLVPGDLVLLDIRDPFYFAAYVFACLHLKLKPALLNSYFKKDQVDGVLKSNLYSLFVTDQKMSGLNTFKIDSSLPFKMKDGDLDIPLESEILFFTSGSIQSKACILTLENFFYNAQGSSENIPFGPSRVWGLCLPLFHVGGFSILIRSLYCEGCIGILDNTQPYQTQMDTLRISHVSFVSTQFIKYLGEKHFLVPRYILLGGSSIPEFALKKALQLKLPIYKSYGMTEMASQICTTSELKTAEDFVFSGKLLKNRELKISNKKIYVKGPCLFKGYLANNKLTTPFDSDGWFDTKDFGEFYEGHIQILGRADRMFQSAGENISPEVIEKELLKISGVLKAYVCAEIDDTHGFRPIAYIEKQDSVDNESILSLLSKNLPGLYRPKALRAWNESPNRSWKQ
jgi:O-succinylbenzoic acid--CoA ligase